MGSRSVVSQHSQCKSYAFQFFPAPQEVQECIQNIQFAREEQLSYDARVLTSRYPAANILSATCGLLAVAGLFANLYLWAKCDAAANSYYQRLRLVYALKQIGIAADSLYYWCTVGVDRSEADRAGPVGVQAFVESYNATVDLGKIIPRTGLLNDFYHAHEKFIEVANRNLLSARNGNQSKLKTNLRIAREECKHLETQLASNQYDVVAEKQWHDAQMYLYAGQISQVALFCILAISATFSLYQHGKRQTMLVQDHSSGKPQVVGQSNTAKAESFLVPDCNVPLTPVSSQSRYDSGAAVYNETSDLRRILDHAVDVICVLDTGGKFVWVSSACLASWGYTPQELQGKELSSFIDQAQVERTMNSICGSETSVDQLFFENRFRCDDGRWIDLLWSAHWSAREGGLFCVVHDITERRLVEETLRQSERRLKTVVEHLPVAVLILDASYQIELCNAAASEMGIKPGDSCAEVLSVAGSDPSSLFARSGDGPREVSVHCDGRQALEVELSSAPLHYVEGVKYLAVLVDVTERQRLDKMKREFFSMVSHDIRGPLTSLEGIMTLFSEGVLGQLNSTGKELTERGRSETGRVIRLVNDLLVFEKAEAGELSIHYERVVLKKIIHSVLDTVRTQADKSEIQLELLGENFACEADGNRISQVLQNLLSNAIKFSPVGQTVQVAVVQENGFAKISVEDRGRGVPEDRREEIFERFKQLDRLDEKLEHGTGLGLSICKTIVDRHRGKIGVSENPAGGSIFWFTIPLGAPAEIAVERCGGAPD